MLVSYPGFPPPVKYFDICDLCATGQISNVELLRGRRESLGIRLSHRVCNHVHVCTCLYTCSWSCLTAVPAATNMEQVAVIGGATKGDIELQEIEQSGALVEEQKPATNYGVFINSATVCS